jgi:hypothetical protein
MHETRACYSLFGVRVSRRLYRRWGRFVPYGCRNVWTEPA